jgi:energy-coupling factor transporter ATP-binding protein EcfA2
MDFKKKKIILIAGNKGSGKNTFSNVLQLIRKDCGFKIYSKSTSSHSFEKSSDLYIEASFAGILKEKVANILGISLNELDELKDKPLSQEILERLKSSYYWFSESPSTPTARDVLIDEALRVRTTDPTFYVRCVVELIQPLSSEKCILITDWRYKNELEFLEQFKDIFEIITVRMESLTAPPVFVPSERDLDNLSFDFICQRIGEDMNPPTHYQYIGDI